MAWRSRKSRLLIAAITAGAFLLPAQLATAQGPSSPQTASESTPAANTKQQQLPTLTAKIGISSKELDRLRAEGREARDAGHKSLPVPDAAPKITKPGARRTAPSDRQPNLTVLEGARLSNQMAAKAARQAQDAKNSSAGAAVAVEEPVNIQGWVPIEDEPNTDRLDACLSDEDAAGRSIGRIYNRYTYCALFSFSMEYWEIDSKGVPVELEGTTKATLRVFGQGDAKDRRVRIWSQIKKDSVDYDWGPWDNIFTAPNVPLTLMASCAQEDTPVCGTSPSGYTLPWATWDNNPIWADWDIYNNDPASEGRDKISYNQWYVEAFTDNEEYKTINPARTAARLVRCDSADYMNQGSAKYPKACVFSEVTPYLTYGRGSAHDGVAEHLDLAFSNPNSTYPLLAAPNVPAPRDKKFPGQYNPDNANAPGLHRITAKLHKDAYNENKYHKDGACFKTGRYKDLYQDTGLPGGTNPGEDCDEYPFRSTLEGASSTDWDFSVKSVNKKQNQVAGGMLRKYYVDDRILAWDAGLDNPKVSNDRFYMKITR